MLLSAISLVILSNLYNYLISIRMLKSSFQNILRVILVASHISNHLIKNVLMKMYSYQLILRLKQTCSFGKEALSWGNIISLVFLLLVYLVNVQVSYSVLAYLRSRLFPSSQAIRVGWNVSQIQPLNFIFVTQAFMLDFSRTLQLIYRYCTFLIHGNFVSFKLKLFLPCSPHFYLLLKSALPYDSLV